jgi:phage terminase large subunit-like protein
VKRAGALTEASGRSLRMLEWALPEDGDADDARQVKRANPASWITLDGIREQREGLQDMAFRRFHCNQIVGREGAWLPAGAWQACAGTPTFEPGERIWIGVDLGLGERSTSAVVYLNERLHIGCEVFKGESAVTDAAEFVLELHERFTVVEAAHDPWQAALLNDLWTQRGIVAVAYPQTDSRLQPASERLHRAVVEKRLKHPDHPDLNAHVHAAIAKTTRRGWKLYRADRDSPIDAVIALAIALDRAEQKPEPVAFYGWV